MLQINFCSSRSLYLLNLLSHHWGVNRTMAWILTRGIAHLYWSHLSVNCNLYVPKMHSLSCFCFHHLILKWVAYIYGLFVLSGHHLKEALWPSGLYQRHDIWDSCLFSDAAPNITQFKDTEFGLHNVWFGKNPFLNSYWL